MVFVGELFGAGIWGPSADRFGRWRASVAAAIFTALFGAVSAASVNFEMLVVMRGLVGVGIGGLSVPFDVLAEFVRPDLRGRVLMSVEYFWCFGTVFAAGMAWLLLERLGWRAYVLICSAPVLLALPVFKLVAKASSVFGGEECFSAIAFSCWDHTEGWLRKYVHVDSF